MRRIILGSPVHSSAKVNHTETHNSSGKSLDKDKDRHMGGSSRRSSILTPPSASHKTLDKHVVEDSDWDEELDTLLTSDTIDTDELEAEIKRQKRKKNKKDKKHKRSRKSKKRKKKRTKSLSSIEPISDNDLDDVLDTNISSRHYTPPAVAAIAAKSPSDPTYTPIKQRSPRSSDTPPPIRPDSTNSYYSESANMTMQQSVSGSSSAPTNNIVGLQVTVSNRGTRHRTPPRTSTTKNRFPNPHSPHTPPLYAGGSSSVSGREIRSSRFVISPNKDDHRHHHHHHHGRPDIAATAGNHHYHQRQTAVTSESHKYKDTDRYYHHQPTTPPHKKRKLQDVRVAVNTQNYYEHARHDSRSSSRNIRATEYDRYNRDYSKRYSRYVHTNTHGMLPFKLKHLRSFLTIYLYEVVFELILHRDNTDVNPK